MTQIEMTQNPIPFENAMVGAMHEAAHAAALISQGRPFLYAEVDSVGCGQVASIPRMVDNTELARVALAGQIVDMEFVVARDGECAVESWIDGWVEIVEYDLENPEDAEVHDTWNIHRDSGFDACVWAAAFYALNRTLIENAGRELLNAGWLDYDELLLLLTDVREPSMEERNIQLDRFMPFLDRLIRIGTANDERMALPPIVYADGLD